MTGRQVTEGGHLKRALSVFLRQGVSEDAALSLIRDRQGKRVGAVW